MILRVTSGPLEGKIFQVEENIILGRSKGNVLLEDPKVSNPHAQIHKSNSQYILKNLSSKRGIHYQDKIVPLVILKPGVIFQLGSTIFQVEEGSSKQNFSSDLSVHEFKEENEEEVRGLIVEQLESSLGMLKDESKNLSFLENPIKLQFEKGVQKNVCWNISYLPRKIGSIDADLPLIDPHAPEISFEIFLEKEKIIFFTYHKDIVLLNYQHTQKAPLKNKDLIIIGAAYIRVLMN